MNGKPVVCDYCGAAVQADGLRIKVTREPVDAEGLPDVTIVNTCSEEHAAAYFAAKRLPPPGSALATADPMQLGWTGRLGLGLAAFAVVAGWGLMVAGLYAVGSWLLAD